jgi:hypothetical protein
MAPVTPKPSTAGFNQQQQYNGPRNTNLPTPTHTPRFGDRHNSRSAGGTSPLAGSSFQDAYSSGNMGEHCCVRRELLKLLDTVIPNSEQFEAEQVYVLDDKTSIWFYIGELMLFDVICQVQSLFSILF